MQQSALLQHSSAKQASIRQARCARRGCQQLASTWAKPMPWYASLSRSIGRRCLPFYAKGAKIESFSDTEREKVIDLSTEREVKRVERKVFFKNFITSYCASFPVPTSESLPWLALCGIPLRGGRPIDRRNDAFVRLALCAGGVEKQEFHYGTVQQTTRLRRSRKKGRI